MEVKTFTVLTQNLCSIDIVFTEHNRLVQRHNGKVLYGKSNNNKACFFQIQNFSPPETESQTLACPQSPEDPVPGHSGLLLVTCSIQTAPALRSRHCRPFPCCTGTQREQRGFSPSLPFPSSSAPRICLDRDITCTRDNSRTNQELPVSGLVGFLTPG